MATLQGANGAVVTVASTASTTDQRVIDNVVAAGTVVGNPTVTSTSSGSTVLVANKTGGDSTALVTANNTVQSTVTVDGGQFQLPPSTGIVVNKSAAATVAASAPVTVPAGTTPPPPATTLVAAAAAVKNEILADVVSFIGNSLGAATTPAIQAGQEALTNTLAQSVNVIVNNIFKVTPNISTDELVTQIYTEILPSILKPFLGSTTSSLQDASSLLAGSDSLAGGADSLVGANEILLKSTSVANVADLFMVDLSATKGNTVVLQDVEAAVLAAPGVVRVEGNAPIIITSSSQAQNYSGGGGRDTLVGTGDDTLTGGAGNDLFSFKGAGKYTVTDFSKTGDKLNFELPGVTNLDQLKAKVTGVTTTATSITYHLGPDTSITLVGVSASDLTASMLSFVVTG